MTRDHHRQDELTADTIHVPCPVEDCPAEVGEPCLRSTGETMRLPHIARITAAKDRRENR